VGIGNSHDIWVGREFILANGTVRGENDSTGSTEGKEGMLREQRMHLHLINGRHYAGVFQQDLQCLFAEVGYANAPNAT
jgi:hypothetical protein